MSGLINFIKGLFSAIFGIFGGKKKADGAIPAAKKGKGFYLELDEAKAEVSAKPAAAPAATASATNGATAESKPAKAQPAKASRKEKLAALAEGSKPAATSTPAPAKAPTATTVATAPKPVEKFEPETAFATKYLVTNGSNGRRRPGANMSPYLDMARKMKA